MPGLFASWTVCLPSELFKSNAKTRHRKGKGWGHETTYGATAPIAYSGINLTIFFLRHISGLRPRNSISSSPINFEATRFLLYREGRGGIFFDKSAYSKHDAL